MRKKIIIFICFLFFCNSILAGSKKTRKSIIEKTLDLLENVYISANWCRYHLGYKEFSDEDVLDEEFGWLKGWDIKLGYLHKKDYGRFWGRPFIEIYGRKIDELITYKGQTQAGNPLNFKTKAKIQRWGAKFGGYRKLSPICDVWGYLDVGRRIWLRGENEVVKQSWGEAIAYKEKYSWTYMGVGAKIEYKKYKPLLLGADFEVLGTFKRYRRLVVYSFKGTANGVPFSLDEYKFRLGSVWGINFELPIKYQLFNHLSLDITPYYTYWKINESNKIDIGGGVYIYEPESKSKIYGVLSGFTFTF